jgi:hypothetical protein
VNGARVVVLTAVLALAVTVLNQGLVGLVEASGARDQPAAILVLLLSAFLGLLTAVVARAMRLHGSVAPTALVLGWIAVPPLLAAIPSQATDLFAGRATLDATEATALAVAVVSAAMTLAISGRGD